MALACAHGADDKRCRCVDGGRFCQVERKAHNGGPPFGPCWGCVHSRARSDREGCAGGGFLRKTGRPTGRSRALPRFELKFRQPGLQSVSSNGVSPGTGRLGGCDLSSGELRSFANARAERGMTYVVVENCIKCKYMDCVEVCPVDCFYEGENMLVIHPDECIDCGVCEPECPVDAIKPDTEPGLEAFLKLNADFAKIWPNITVKREPAPDPKEWEGKPEKVHLLSPNPGTGD